MIKGIDVSRWQGIINWPIVSRNIDFAIIKLGGSDQGFYQDGQAVRNVLEARANNVPTAFYVYLGGASSVADEINHIKNMVNNIGGLRPGEFVELDWEEHHSDEVGYIYGIAKGLIDSGFPAPPIYMSLSRVQQNDWRRVAQELNCALHVAAWGNNDDKPDTAPPSDEWPFWAIWQYSSVGTVPGVSGRVDMNLFNGDVTTFKKYGARGTVTMPTTVNTSKVVFNSSAAEYTVVKGDNLSMIAGRWGKSWQELWNMNRDRVSNPDKIYPGLKLRVWGASPGQAAQVVAAPADPGRWYTVVEGDNLSSIAARYGLPSYVLIWEANKDQISNPDLIRPGMKLRIP